ncbi:hypothetical protein HDZ31DRAFT_9884, partial [Schizophyllum fasciatum]
SSMEYPFPSSRSSGKHTAALALYSAIRRNCAASSLRHICVPTNSEGRALAANTLFADLLAFPLIERAEIVFMHVKADIDAAIDCMSASWPCLTHLSLTHKRREESGGARMVRLATLRGLLPLGQRCPNLTFLKVDIDPDSAWPPPDALEGGLPLVRKNLTFSIRPIPERHATAIDMFLRILFP